jgi:16S rRNA processing protein RimM
MGGVESLISVGIIIRPHGIRGEIKIAPLTNWPERFKEFQSLYIEGEEGVGKWVEVEKRRMQGKYVILKLAGINNRDAADSLRNQFLRIDQSECPPLPKGTFYIFDLIGLEVKTTRGDKVGSLIEIMQLSMQDVYVVNTGDREILIPAVKQFIKKVSIQDGVILVEPIEGLLE